MTSPLFIARAIFCSCIFFLLIPTSVAAEEQRFGVIMGEAAISGMRLWQDLEPGATIGKSGSRLHVEAPVVVVADDGGFFEPDKVHQRMRAEHICQW